MTVMFQPSTTNRYARCVEASKRVHWEIDKDIIRGRRFDTAHKFLPDGLSLAAEFKTLSADEKRFVSQIQGRTYANIFGLVERFINAKVLELSHDHWFGDQVALEALVRFSDEELKHQALFRRIDAMIGEVHARRLSLRHRSQRRRPCRARQEHVGGAGADAGHRAVHAAPLPPEHRARFMLSELFKDVFLFHWREESQHAILDELEWVRHDAGDDGGAARPRGRRIH